VVNGGYTWDLTKSTKNIIKKLRKLISQLDWITMSGKNFVLNGDSYG
jgi:hypothetical protein